MSIADKLTTIAENEQKVYKSGCDEGYEQGKTDGYTEGKTAESNEFWEAFQIGGNHRYYQYAFYGPCWTDRTYNPKYDVISNNANSIYSNSNITDTKVTVDISGLQTTARDTFSGCVKLKTIRKFVVNNKLQYSGVFTGCSALENITVEGEIGNSISFANSPLLSDASLVSIIYHLATVSTTKTLTLHPDRLSTMDTGLIAEATSRGWDVVA